MILVVGVVRKLSQTKTSSGRHHWKSKDMSRWWPAKWDLEISGPLLGTETWRVHSLLFSRVEKLVCVVLVFHVFENVSSSFSEHRFSPDVGSTSRGGKNRCGRTLRSPNAAAAEVGDRKLCSCHLTPAFCQHHSLLDAKRAHLESGDIALELHQCAALHRTEPIHSFRFLSFLSLENAPAKMKSTLFQILHPNHQMLKQHDEKQKASP